MDKVFILIYSNFMEDDVDRIVGVFSSRESALNFITYLRKGKRMLDGSFEVHLAEAMTTAQNVANYEEGLPTTTLVASTWYTKKALKPNQVVLYDNGNEKIVELYKEKENAN